jgi:hypothetical protein
MTYTPPDPKDSKWKWWCESCGTVTDDSKQCDCTDMRLDCQKLHPYPFPESKS